MCDACGAETAFVNVVMQDTVPSGSGAYLDHESMTEFGPPESQKESQGPRAFNVVLFRTSSHTDYQITSASCAAKLRAEWRARTTV